MILLSTPKLERVQHAPNSRQKHLKTVHPNRFIRAFQYHANFFSANNPSTPFSYIIFVKIVYGGAS